MLTSKNIQEVKFGKAVRGYKEEDVDAFLDELTLTMDELAAEKSRLEAELAAREVELDRYRGTEENVFKTLNAAKSLMGDISLSAEKRAEVIIKNAELEAEYKIKEASAKAERIIADSKDMKLTYDSFAKRYKALLIDELAKFDVKQEELFPELKAVEDEA